MYVNSKSYLTLSPHQSPPYIWIIESWACLSPLNRVSDHRSRWTVWTTNLFDLKPNNQSPPHRWTPAIFSCQNSSNRCSVPDLSTHCCEISRFNIPHTKRIYLTCYGHQETIKHSYWWITIIRFQSFHQPLVNNRHFQTTLQVNPQKSSNINTDGSKHDCTPDEILTTIKIIPHPWQPKWEKQQRAKFFVKTSRNTCQIFIIFDLEKISPPPTYPHPYPTESACQKLKIHRVVLKPQCFNQSEDLSLVKANSSDISKCFPKYQHKSRAEKENLTSLQKPSPVLPISGNTPRNHHNNNNNNNNNNNKTNHPLYIYYPTITTPRDRVIAVHQRRRRPHWIN